MISMSIIMNCGMLVSYNSMIIIIYGIWGLIVIISIVNDMSCKGTDCCDWYHFLK